jgi:hypothetical protein
LIISVQNTNNFMFSGATRRFPNYPLQQPRPYDTTWQGRSLGDHGRAYGAITKRPVQLHARRTATNATQATMIAYRIAQKT